MRDVIARADEALEGRPLLGPVMRSGFRLDAGRVTLDEIKENAESELGLLPTQIRTLAPADPPYPVLVSETLSRYHEEVKETVARSASAARRV